jgi:hypothetical protein
VIEHDTPTPETLALMLQYYGYDVMLAQKPIDPPLLNKVIHDELAPVRSS